MQKQQRAIEIAYLIPDQFWISTISGAVEVFHGMQLNSRVFQSSSFRGFEVTFLRCTREKVTGFSGLRFDTQYFDTQSVADKAFDVVIVPSVWELSMDSLERARPALSWLKRQYESGSVVVGLVTGVFYLAEAGILHGREATMHWASMNTFCQRYPEVKVSPKIQMVESERIITTSTTPATFDVILLLIQRFLGDRSAELASHYFTIRDKNAPLPGFLEPSCNDALVDAARDVIKMNFAQELSLEHLATQLSVTARTLSRRFVSSTGMTPIAYLNKHRLNFARQLLQSTNLQIQQIAEQSGFASSTVFSRNFKKAFAQTPGQYRASISGSK